MPTEKIYFREAPDETYTRVSKGGFTPYGKGTACVIQGIPGQNGWINGFEVVAERPKDSPYQQMKRLGYQMGQNSTKAWENSYEFMKAKEEGGDIAGNLIMAPFATYLMANPFARLAMSGLSKLGMATTLGGSLLGGKIAHDTANEVLKSTTGKTYGEHMYDAGMWRYNSEAVNPATWDDAYAGSKILPFLFTNGLVSANNQLPTKVYTSDGQVLDMRAGESVTYPTIKAITQNPNPVRIVGRTNTNRATSGTGTWNAGKSTYVDRVGYTTKPGQKVITENVTVSGPPVMPAVPVMPGFPVIPPYVDNPDTITPPVPPVIPPEPRKSNHTVVEEVVTNNPPFIEWYRKQPEGTVQYYEAVSGDPHESGQYWIQRTKADPVIVQRNVGETLYNDGKSNIIPDSTTYRYIPRPMIQPAETIITPNQNFWLFDGDPNKEPNLNDTVIKSAIYGTPANLPDTTIYYNREHGTPRRFNNVSNDTIKTKGKRRIDIKVP